MPSPAPVVHFEIGCQNIEKARRFFGEVFGWEYAPNVVPNNAAMVGNLGPFAASPTAGIGGHLNSLGHPPHQYVTVYIQVDDIEQALAKIERASGSTLIPKQEVPGMGWFAWFKDPEGNVLGLWKTMKM
ncbi:MAG: VOC family protein [Phycisphaerae bacterium]|nr:VOC family protein [Phycisphaerae bacterium]